MGAAPPTLAGDLRAALRSALEQPEQEPVAWMDREGDLYRMPVIENWSPPHTLLYTAPPQRKPLTDDEISLLYMRHTDRPRRPYWEFARAIEAAHGIKGEA